MKVRFKVNAEWEEEVPNDELQQIAEDEGGENPSEEEMKAALILWAEGREDSIRDNPGEIPASVDINVSFEQI